MAVPTRRVCVPERQRSLTRDFRLGNGGRNGLHLGVANFIATVILACILRGCDGFFLGKEQCDLSGGAPLRRLLQLSF